MPINYGLLQQPQKNDQSGIVAVGAPAQAPSAPSSDGGGIGELVSGLSSFADTLGPSTGVAPDAPGSSTQGYVQNAVTGGNEGLRALGQSPEVVGTNTQEPRLNQLVSGQGPNTGNGIWDNASKQLGLKEGNPVLTDYLKKANPNLDPSVTPWCAGYVGSVLNASGLKGTGSLAAKSYLQFGNPTENPTKGDIVVLNRTNDPSLGHVGFYAGRDDKNNVLVLGGNQDNSVSVKPFSPQQVAGYRTPPSGQQVQQYAQKNNIQDPEGIKNLTQGSQKAYHPELQQTVAGIQHVESGGAENPYGVVGKATKTGDRAYGYSQIMGSNIPSWTKEALGYPMTPQQYLKNPEAQKQTTEFQVNKLLNQYGTPQDAASAWFTGRPLAKVKGNPKDAYGTSNSDYQKRFNQGYLRAKMKNT